MNKAKVVKTVSEKTGMDEEMCRGVMDALEQISTNALMRRVRGDRLDESQAVGEIAEKAGVSESDCKNILAAFEETFGEAISDKFHFFRRSDKNRGEEKA